MFATLAETIAQCRERLRSHYGARLQGLRLYGSCARQEATQESDLDLLVLLAEPFDYFAELRTLSDLLYPVQLESTHLISAKPASYNEFQEQCLQLYRNIARDGIPV